MLLFTNMLLLCDGATTAAVVTAVTAAAFIAAMSFVFAVRSDE